MSEFRKANGFSTLALGAAVAVTLSGCGPGTGVPSDLDVVILNGRVMDPETEFDGVRNVGIKGGMIAVITEAPISGRETIDATGLVVAPGFIDTHFHAIDGLGMKMAARDGMTTALDLEGGVWNVDQWYQAKEGQWPLNYGAAASHERAREIVLDGMTFDEPVDALTLFTDRAKAGEDGTLGWAATRPDLDQMNSITQLLDEQLRQGAIGVASLVGYARGGVTTYELFEVQRAAARYGRLYSSHQRFHGNPTNPQAALGFDEMFTNAVVLGAPLMVAHNNDADWWEIEEKLQRAREMGMNVWSEYYPYAAASSEVNAEYMQPAIFEDIMGYSYIEDVYDPTQDKFLSKEEVLELQKTDPSHTIVIHLPPRKRWLPYWLQVPHMTVASDAMWMDGGRPVETPFDQYQGHPRTAGSHGTVLRMGRENGVPLMFAISQLSYWSAKHLGDAGLESMKVRGRLQEGMVADITIFDPENVRENSTYKTGEQGLPTTGIPYVLVSGVMVVEDSEFQQDVFPGQPLRYPVEEQGRFEPATAEKWLAGHSLNASVPDVHDEGPDAAARERYRRIGGSR